MWRGVLSYLKIFCAVSIKDMADHGSPQGSIFRHPSLFCFCYLKYLILLLAVMLILPPVCPVNVRLSSPHILICPRNLKCLLLIVWISLKNPTCLHVLSMVFLAFVGSTTSASSLFFTCERIHYDIVD